jgi:hypothetical protein
MLRHVLVNGGGFRSEITGTCTALKNFRQVDEFIFSIQAAFTRPRYLPNRSLICQ